MKGYQKRGVKVALLAKAMESKPALFERSFAKDIAAAEPSGQYTPAAAPYPITSVFGTPRAGQLRGAAYGAPRSAGAAATKSVVTALGGKVATSAAGGFAFRAAAPQLAAYNSAQYVSSTISPLEEGTSERRSMRRQQPPPQREREQEHDNARDDATPLPKHAASKMPGSGEMDDAAYAKGTRAPRLPSPVHRGYDENAHGGADGERRSSREHAWEHDCGDVSLAFAPARSTSPIPLLGASPKASGATAQRAAEVRSKAVAGAVSAAHPTLRSGPRRVAPMAAPG